MTKSPWLDGLSLIDPITPVHPGGRNDGYIGAS
jgi:hypothetical protein